MSSDSAYGTIIALFHSFDHHHLLNYWKAVAVHCRRCRRLCSTFCRCLSLSRTRQPANTNAERQHWLLSLSGLSLSRTPSPITRVVFFSLALAHSIPSNSAPPLLALFFAKSVCLSPLNAYAQVLSQKAQQQQRPPLPFSVSAHTRVCR